jgi:hypothetical protein
VHHYTWLVPPSAVVNKAAVNLCAHIFVHLTSILLGIVCLLGLQQTVSQTEWLRTIENFTDSDLETQNLGVSKICTMPHSKFLVASGHLWHSLGYRNNVLISSSWHLPCALSLCTDVPF